jgi:hypothetical protein
MKTKTSLLQWIMIMALVVISTGAMAQNQNPTQTVCIGSQSYSVDASLLPSPVYTWAVSAGGTIVSGQGTINLVVDWTLVGGPYTLSVFTTSNGCSGTPQTVAVTVAPLLITTVVLAASVDPVCTGTSVTYTANVTNGGTPVYEWHVNGGASLGTNNAYSYIPVAGDVITCIVTGNALCTSGAPVTGTFSPVVNPLPSTLPIWHS